MASRDWGEFQTSHLCQSWTNHVLCFKQFPHSLTFWQWAKRVSGFKWFEHIWKWTYTTVQMAPHSHSSSERRWACLDFSMQKVEGGLLKITDSLLSPAGQSFSASVLVCFTELCWLNELYGQYFSVLVTVMQDVRSESVGLQCVCIPPLVDSTGTPLFLGKRWASQFCIDKPKNTVSAWAADLIEALLWHRFVRDHVSFH